MICTESSTFHAPIQKVYATGRYGDLCRDRGVDVYGSRIGIHMRAWHRNHSDTDAFAEPLRLQRVLRGQEMMVLQGYC